MGLEEEAVRAALMGLTDLPAGVEGPSLPTPQQAGLNSVYAGGATQYEYPMNDLQGRGGLPVGATSDPRSPLGYTIEDPLLRNQAAQFSGGLAKAVAQQQYMDAYLRDRQNNTAAMLKTASNLDPDMQALILQRLGIPGAGPGANTSGIPELKGMEGIMSSRLRNALLPKILENRFNTPYKDTDQLIRLLTAQAAQQNADTNEKYRQGLSDRGDLAQQIGIVGKLKELMSARQTLMQPGPGRDLNKAAMIGQIIDFIGSNFLGGGSGDSTVTPDESGYAGIPGLTAPAAPANPPAGGRAAAMMRNPPAALRPRVTRIN